MRELKAVDVLLPRADRVAADSQNQLASLEDVGFGIGTIRKAGFVAAYVSKQERVGKRGREGRRERKDKRVSGRERRAGVFERVLLSRILKISAREPLSVPAAGKEVRGCDVQVDPREHDILLKGAQPGRGALLQIVDGPLLICSYCRVGREGEPSGKIEQNEILRFASLAVIVQKEEKLILYQGTAERSSELVKVIRGLGQAVYLVDQIVRIHGFVSVIPECRSVEFVGARFRDHIDDAGGGAAEFGLIGVSIYLELLNGRHAELIGGQTGTGLSENFRKVGIVVVCAVHAKEIHFALASKTEVEATRTASPAGSEQNKIEVVATVDRKAIYPTLIHNGTYLTPGGFYGGSGVLNGDGF